MFVMSKRRVLLPSKDGNQSYLIPRDYVGDIPDWATGTDYFRALVADGKIVVPESYKDRDTQAAEEKAVKVRRGSKITEE